MLKKDGRIGHICWNRARTLQYLGLSRHILEVTSNYTDFLTLATWFMCSIICRRVHNTKPVSQHLLAAKSRIAPKGQSVPRLELTAALMLEKLQSNILESLEKYPIKSCHCWVDSTTVLYWFLTRVLGTVYVKNRV